MPDVVLTLGSVQFQDFEIPSEIPWGGKQSLKVHSLLGGDRVVDVLGIDNAPISWSGRFQGSNALARAQQLDQIRRAGNPVTLSWGGLSYLVVVEDFKPNFQRTYQGTYSISCVVISDNTIPQQASTATLDDLIDSDLSDAQADLSTI